MMSELFKNPFLLAGWLLCVGVVIWFLLVYMRSIKAQRMQQKQFAQSNLLLEEKLKLLKQRRELVKNSSEGWEGFANFVVTDKVVHGDSGICSFYLKPKNGKLELASFLPGQHLVFQLPVAGLAQPITRRYSLSDRPGKDCYRVSVKLQLPPESVEGAPAGLGSSYFHQELEQMNSSGYGGLVQASSPAGSFCLDPMDSQPVVLIGGGAGITPMLSMFNSIVAENDSREVWLFYAVRNEADNILMDEKMLHPDAKELLQERENVHLHVYYSKLASLDVLSQDEEGLSSHCGRLGVGQLKEQLPSNNYRFFICGPEGMMDQFEDELLAWGVPEEDVLSERFQPPSKKKSIGDGFSSRTIKFAKSGKEIQSTSEDNSILDVAERAGVAIAYDCRAGSCGQCKIPLVSGKVDYTIRTNYKCAPGSCLTCSCLPDGDVVLDC